MFFVYLLLCMFKAWYSLLFRTIFSRSKPTVTRLLISLDLIFVGVHSNVIVKIMHSFCKVIRLCVAVVFYSESSCRPSLPFFLKHSIIVFSSLFHRCSAIFCFIVINYVLCVFRYLNR